MKKMKKTKKHLALLLTAVMVICLFTGCSSDESTAGGTQENGGVVSENSDGKTVATYGMDTLFDVIAPFNFANVSAYTYVYEGMAQRTVYGASWEDMELVCAKSITKVDDLTYDIEMYDYIQDAAGNHITADDYVWVGETILARNENFKVSAYLDSITKLGDYSVELKLTTAGLGNVEYLLTYIPVISRAAFEASEDEMVSKPVTTAAYQVESFASGTSMVMVKNENYWQTDDLRYSWAAANVDEIHFEAISEANQMSIALQTGTVDLAGAVSTSVIGDFYDTETQTAKDGYIVKEYPSTLITFLMFNCSDDSVCSDKTLREAICYGVNSQEILSLAADNLGITLNAFSSPCASDYQTAWDEREYFPQDQERAAELLNESAYTSGSVLKLLCLNADMNIKAAQVIQNELGQIGITVQITQVDMAVFDATIADSTQWDILLYQRGVDDYSTFPWSLVFDANAYESGKTQNFIDDAELQRLLQEAMGVDTHSDETVAAFEQYIEDNAYVLGLFSEMRYFVANSDTVSDLFMRDYVQAIPGACTYQK